MRDLIDLWLRLPGANPADLDRLEVSFRASQIVGGIRQGKRGLILPVFVDPPSIYRTVEEPALVDLVGFDPNRPSDYRPLYGNGVLLGEAAYREAIEDSQPLPVFRDPLAWLRAGGGGVVPLHLGQFINMLVGRPWLTLVGQDYAFSEALSDLFHQTPRQDLPEIRVAA
jgi:hypothetical protein